MENRANPDNLASSNRGLGRLRNAWFILVCVAMLAGVAMLPGSRSSGPESRVRVVCTFVPLYVFALNVVGDVPDVRVDLLVAADTGCPHNYALTAADLRRVQQAGIIVANGLGLEPFLDRLALTNPDAVVVKLGEVCDVLPANPDHEHAHEHHATPHEPGHGDESSTCGADHDEGFNPHVWVSPREASRQVLRLAEALGEVDPANAARYRTNAERYAKRLNDLSATMKRSAAGFNRRSVVTFHDAFAYLARDLDLHVAATLTVEPDHPIAPKHKAEVIDTIRREQVAAVFYEPAYSREAAETTARDAGVPALALDPFNAVTNPTPDSYERIMAGNLRVLESALRPAP